MSLFRTILMSKRKELLPNDYIQLEYIENGSDAYIDTLVKPNYNTKIDIELEPTVFQGWRPFFGVRGANMKSAYFVSFDGSRPNFHIHFGNTGAITENKGALGVHTLTHYQGITNIDGTVFNHPLQNYSSSYNLYLFGYNNNGNYEAGNTNLRIYYCKLYQLGKIIRNYIPAQQKSTGKNGLYDLVENKFYVSPNGTPFIGKEVIELPKEYIELEYIENTSNAYIDTNYRPNNNTKIETKLDILSFNAWKGFFGCRGANAAPAYALYFSSTDIFYGHFGPSTSYYINSTCKATGIHNIEFYKGVLKVDSEVYKTNDAVYQLPLNMFIFATNENNTKIPHSNIKVYSFKIYEDNKLIRNYIPAKRKFDNAVGLYDIVNDKFYLSPNNTKFIGGYKIDTSTQSFITAAKITNQNHIQAINNLVIGLKDSKIWDKINALYPFVGGNAEAHSYNLIDTSKHKISWANGVTHDAKGVCGHNSTGSNLNFNTSVIKDKFNVSTYTQNNIAANDSLIISNPADNNRINVHTKWSNNVTFFDYNTHQVGRMSGVIPTGAYRFMSFNVTNQKRIIYQDKVQRFTSNTQLINAPQVNLDFAHSWPNANSPRIYSFLSLGSGLSDDELLIYNNLIDEFQAKLGRKV